MELQKADIITKQCVLFSQTQEEYLVMSECENILFGQYLQIGGSSNRAHNPAGYYCSSKQ